MSSTISSIENHKSQITNLFGPLPVVAVAALVIFAALWWVEHDARLRREEELKEMRRQSAAEISSLQAKADAAVRDANQSNARAASELEASRRLLEQQAQNLRQRLATLEQTEHTRVEQVAVLPVSEISKRLSEQLGPGAITGETTGVGSRVWGVGKAGSRESGVGGREGRSLISSSATLDTLHPAPANLLLTEAGARKVETALVELDSCRQESSVQSQQLAACQREGAAEAAMVEQQKSSIAKLNGALADKDQVLAKQQTEFKAELKVAKGTVLSRVGRVIEYVAAGVVIGKVL